MQIDNERAIKQQCDVITAWANRVNSVIEQATTSGRYLPDICPPEHVVSAYKLVHSILASERIAASILDDFSSQALVPGEALAFVSYVEMVVKVTQQN